MHYYFIFVLHPHTLKKVTPKLIIFSIYIWLHGTMSECIQPFLHCLPCKKEKRKKKEEKKIGEIG